MFFKHRWALILGSLLLGSVLVYGVISLFPLSMLTPQQKPEQPPQKTYDYYLIIDNDTNKTLMYVPLVVSVGDEVITEENKRYQVIRIEENRAYARFVENVNLEKYKPNP
jgi:hypothetical protein